MNKFNTNLSFTDLAFNLLLVFICLFAIALLSITKKTPTVQESSLNKTEFIIRVEWDKFSKNDVDVYVEDPVGNIVYFRNKTAGLMHLDRDDLGTRNDTIVAPNGQVIEVFENQEIVSIRGIVPGEYTINVRLYFNSDNVKETPVLVTLEKMNPSVKMIHKEKVILEFSAHQITAFRFTLDRNGNVSNINNKPKRLTKF